MSDDISKKYLKQLDQRDMLEIQAYEKIIDEFKKYNKEIRSLKEQKQARKAFELDQNIQFR